MTYKGKQKQVKKFSSEKPEDTHYNFEVRFNFRREVAPKDREVIRKRIDDLFNNKRERLTSLGNLSRNTKGGLRFILYSFLRSSSISMENVKAIDRYVLTGDKTGIDILNYD